MALKRQYIAWAAEYFTAIMLNVVDHLQNPLAEFQSFLIPPYQGGKQRGYFCFCKRSSDEIVEISWIMLYPLAFF